MHFDTTSDIEFPAAAALTGGLPCDQALGLRLMAMARAAAATHMGAVAMGGSRPMSAGMDMAAQECGAERQLLRSQAGRLLEAIRNHGQDARATQRAMEGA